jgi:hypothetical protein
MQERKERKNQRSEDPEWTKEIKKDERAGGGNQSADEKGEAKGDAEQQEGYFKNGLIPEEEFRAEGKGEVWSLSEEERSYVEGWEQPAEQGWKNRLREDRDFGLLIRLLEGQEVDDKESKRLSKFKTHYTLHDNVLYTKVTDESKDTQWVVAVVPPGYRVIILHEHHDEPTTGHRGRD